MQLNLPKAALKIITKGGKDFVFDPWQKKYLQLKPEEFVRVNLLHFLITQKGFSPNLGSIEKGITLIKRKKRLDALFYNNLAEPVLLIECKAPYIEIDQKVLHQAMSYNLEVKAKFILLSNGMNHLFLNSKNNEMQWLKPEDFPSFEQLNAL